MIIDLPIGPQCFAIRWLPIPLLEMKGWGVENDFVSVRAGVHTRYNRLILMTIKSSLYVFPLLRST